MYLVIFKSIQTVIPSPFDTDVFSGYCTMLVDLSEPRSSHSRGNVYTGYNIICELVCGSVPAFSSERQVGLDKWVRWIWAKGEQGCASQHVFPPHVNVRLHHITRPFIYSVLVCRGK